MQTDRPYWLEEAYTKTGIGYDNGMATRTIQLIIDTLALLYQFQYDAKKLFVDFGGGTGIFTRLMRDHGFNFFHYDKYEIPYFSDPYTIKDLDPFRPHVITAYEVFEHLPEPAETLDFLFRRGPELLLFCTDIFQLPASPTWYYLAAPTGQHIFFYSEKALAEIAQRYGYVFRNLGLIKLFAHPGWIAELRAQGGDFEAVCTLALDRPRFDHYAINLFAQSHLGLTAGMRSRVTETAPASPAPL
jgi:2-polyprenyl-3-methyl-5-hydroxy-6-metoxy-1,4-benzoquinol methylase